MASIPISLLPNVQPSGYTPQDLLVIVNYDFPVLSPTGTTKNTPLSGLSSYIASAITSSPITFNSPVTFNGGLSSTTIVTSAITVNGSGVFNSGLTASSIVTSAITVNGPSVFSSITANNITTSAITVNGPSIFNSGATVNGDLIVSGTVSADTGIFNYLSANTANIDSLTATTISASTYLNLPGSSSANCFNDFYTDNLHACNTVITFHNSYQSVSSTSNGIESRSFGDTNTADGDYSHAEGYDTISTGEYSHSEGQSTNSIGPSSHAEGFETTSTGNHSHSEGRSTDSFGNYSHSEGFETTSTGNYSHSEGGSTNSIGDYSHTEGYKTESVGEYSHSEGYETSSIGYGSHSEGASTISGWRGFELGINIDLNILVLDGSYLDVTSSFPPNSEIIIRYQIGFTSYQEIYPYSYSTFTSLTNTEIILPSPLPFFLGPNCYVASINELVSPSANNLFGDYSHSEGYDTKSLGYGSHSEGRSTNSFGNYSHAEGILTRSIGVGSHAEGCSFELDEFNNPVYVDGGISIGVGSHAEGGETISSGMSSHSEGGFTTSVGDYSHAEGFETIAGYVGYSIDNYDSAGLFLSLDSTYGDVTSYFPGGNILINGNVITYTGSTFSATSNTVLFLSYQTDLFGVSSGDVVVDILDLYNNSGVADKYVGPSHSEGEKTLSIGYGSHSEGYQTTTYGLFSNAKGYITKSYGNYSVSEGYETVSFGDFSSSRGFNTKSIGIGSNSEGQRTISGGKFFVYQQIISGVTVSINSDVDLSSEFPSDKVVIQDNNFNFIIRNYSSTSWNPITEKFTINLINSGDYGYITSQNGFVADIEKLDSFLLSGQQGSKSIVGVFSHSEGGSGMFGEKNLALNNYSHTEGYETKALGEASHSEGNGSVSIGGASHSEGISNKTFGAGSHSEGNTNVSYGDYSHSEGLETKAGWKGLSVDSVVNGLITLDDKYLDVSSIFSYNEVFLDGKFYPISGCVYNTGINSTQIQLSNTDISSGSFVSPGDDLYNFYGNYYLGENSHSEGSNTRAVGINSHSEGNVTSAIGRNSHSEGEDNYSYGRGSHSEGVGTKSFGEASHSEGSSTKSYGENSHSEGFEAVSGWRGFSLDSSVSGGTVILNSGYGDITSEFIFTGTLLLGTSNGNFIYDYSGVTYNSGNTTVEIQLINTAVTGNYIAVAPTQDLENKFADIFLGSFSHSEGRTTHSIGDGSHSEGIGTVTYGHYQHATGMYNITGDTHQGAFIIGNGTDDSNRSNLLRAAGTEVNVSGKTITTNFQMTSGATSTGYVLVDSDGNGNAQWQPISFITGGTLMSTSEINVSAYTATTSFDYYGTTYSGGPITIQLPNPTSTPNGFRLTIKDETTNSALNSITITTPSGSIDNNPTVIMSTNQMSLTLVVRNNNWWII
jgi:hypothetical protein